MCTFDYITPLLIHDSIDEEHRYWQSYDGSLQGTWSPTDPHRHLFHWRDSTSDERLGMTLFFSTSNQGHLHQIWGILQTVVCAVELRYQLKGSHYMCQPWFTERGRRNVSLSNAVDRNLKNKIFWTLFSCRDVLIRYLLLCFAINFVPVKRSVPDKLIPSPHHSLVIVFLFSRAYNNSLVFSLALCALCITWLECYLMYICLALTNSDPCK